MAKITGKEGETFSGTALVYDSEELMMAALDRKEIKAGIYMYVYIFYSDICMYVYISYILFSALDRKEIKAGNTIYTYIHTLYICIYIYIYNRYIYICISCLIYIHMYIRQRGNHPVRGAEGWPRHAGDAHANFGDHGRWSRQ